MYKQQHIQKTYYNPNQELIGKDLMEMIQITRMTKIKERETMD